MRQSVLSRATPDLSSNSPTSIKADVIIQEGNNLPKTRLQTKQSTELADNRIGGQWTDFWRINMAEIVNSEILPLGLKRVRLAINALGTGEINWNKPELSIDPKDDDVITRLAENGVTITYVLSFWDKATWPGGEGANALRFKTEGEIERYLEFVRFIVRHFKDRIQRFEMWNEPGDIAVQDYANLVKHVVPIIREYRNFTIKKIETLKVRSIYPIGTEELKKRISTRSFRNGRRRYNKRR